jgi:hypothetical protein
MRSDLNDPLKPIDSLDPMALPPDIAPCVATNIYFVDNADSIVITFRESHMM